VATAEFRTSDYLDSPETIAAYLEMAMEDPDPAMFMMALRNIAECKGMKEVAGETGLNLQTLYHTLSDKGNPTLQTLTSLLHAFGLRLAVKPENLTYGHA
jgi:probable addiction module antidote protein